MKVMNEKVNVFVVKDEKSLMESRINGISVSDVALNAVKNYIEMYDEINKNKSKYGGKVISLTVHIDVYNDLDNECNVLGHFATEASADISNCYNYKKFQTYICELMREKDTKIALEMFNSIREISQGIIPVSLTTERF